MYCSIFNLKNPRMHLERPEHKSSSQHFPLLSSLRNPMSPSLSDYLFLNRLTWYSCISGVGEGFWDIDHECCPWQLERHHFSKKLTRKRKGSSSWNKYTCPQHSCQFITSGLLSSQQKEMFTSTHALTILRWMSEIVKTKCPLKCLVFCMCFKRSLEWLAPVQHL